MSERDNFFAIIPIHGRNALVEGKDIEVLKQGIDEVLKKPEEVYPFHDFRAETIVIKGRKVKLPK